MFAGAVAVVLVGIARVGLATLPAQRTAVGRWPMTPPARVLATTGAKPVLLDGIPPFKTADALRFPLVRRGTTVLLDEPRGRARTPATASLVIVCDPLFDEVVGVACGGPAEDAWLDRRRGRGPAPRRPVPGADLESRTISVYARP